MIIDTPRPKPLAAHRSERVSSLETGQRLLSLPFDTLRAQYASVVMAGLAPRSLIASGQSERALDALEKLTLGPLARQR